jgi:hypothetical protein
MVQEMIVSAFSALSFQFTGSSSWILDSSASNHMTNSLHGLSNVREYYGSSDIQTANDSVLLIVAFGDICISFKDVLVSSKLSMNLAFVGQLDDQNYDVHTLLMVVVLCKIKCTLGQLIAKGPKHGCLFYLQQPIPRSLPSFPFCLYFVISLGCQMKSGINALVILILRLYLIC